MKNIKVIAHEILMTKIANVNIRKIFYYADRGTVVMLKFALASKISFEEFKKVYEQFDQTTKSLIKDLSKIEEEFNIEFEETEKSYISTSSSFVFSLLFKEQDREKRDKIADKLKKMNFVSELP